MVGFTILLQFLQSCYCHLCVLAFDSFDWDDDRVRDLAGEGLIHTNPSTQIAAWRGIITLQHHSLGGGDKRNFDSGQRISCRSGAALASSLEIKLTGRFVASMQNRVNPTQSR